jgi:competence protein ComGC
MKLTLNQTPRQDGFTLIEVGILLAIVGLVLAVALPNFAQARDASRRGACLANLKQLHDAKQAWGMEFRKKGSDVPAAADLIGPDKYLREKPSCPSGGADYLRHIGPLEGRPGCSLGSQLGHAL